MAITPTTIEMWSKKDQANAIWTIELEKAVDEGGNESSAYVARYGDEFHKYSPSTTDQEFFRQVTAINEEKAPQE